MFLTSWGGSSAVGSCSRGESDEARGAVNHRALRRNGSRARVDEKGLDGSSSMDGVKEGGRLSRFAGGMAKFDVCGCKKAPECASQPQRGRCPHPASGSPTRVTNDSDGRRQRAEATAAADGKWEADRCWERGLVSVCVQTGCKMCSDLIDDRP